MNEKIAKLNDLGDPREIDKRSKWIDYLQYGFTEKDVPELLAIVMDTALYEDTDRKGDCIWIHLHAWRTLGQLKARSAIMPLLSMFNFYVDVEDDWAFDELSDVMGMIGEDAIAPLLAYLCDDSGDEYALVIANDSLGKIAKSHSDSQDKVLAAYKVYMSAPNCTARTLNGLLVGQLIDLKAIELIDDIRQLFQNDCVEISVSGDIEDIEIELGLRKERETPRPHYGMLIKEKVEEMQALLGMTETNTQSDVEAAFTPKAKKIGRNEPCPCGSGKKYKKCCLH